MNNGRMMQGGFWGDVPVGTLREQFGYIEARGLSLEDMEDATVVVLEVWREQGFELPAERPPLSNIESILRTRRTLLDERYEACGGWKAHRDKTCTHYVKAQPTPAPML